MPIHTVAQMSELPEGEMKQVQAGETDVLLVRIGGEVHALAATCPHHGAPLAEGLLHDGRILCPWHMAEFSARDGSLLQPPALQGLPHFEVTIDGEEIRVEIPDDAPTSCDVAMAEYDPEKDDRTFVILGAGAAGMTAAETLRQEGFAGRIVMLTRDETAGYDRTDLSKPYLRSEEPSDPVIRDEAFYRKHGIDVRTGVEVTQVDTLENRLAMADGEELTYDRLLLASGSSPRRLDVPGADIEGVVTLRTLPDARGLRQRIDQARKAVIVGASFIGMEVAAGCVAQGLEVEVVAPEAVPFERVFGEAIGRMYQSLHEEKGVVFHLGQTVGHFVGDAKVQAVVLTDGTELPADLVVLGVGVRPATDYLQPTLRNEDGSVSVNDYLQLRGDVYAAGDIARFADWRGGQPTRIEHWRVAQQQGRTAARNMLGAQDAYRCVPFFWTNQYMVITDYVGHAEDWDEIVIDGEIDQQEFLAWFIKDQAVHAVAGCGRSRAIAAVVAQMRNEPLPTLQTLRQATGEFVHAG